MIFGYVFKDTNKKFTCVYRRFDIPSKGGANFCPGFPNKETAIEWFMIRHPNGNLTTKENFDQMIQKLVEKNPVTPANLNPLNMEGLDRPRKSSKRGQSDFE